MGFSEDMIESESTRFLLASAFNWLIGVFFFPFVTSLALGFLLSAVYNKDRAFVQKIATDEEMLGIDPDEIKYKNGMIMLMLNPGMLLKMKEYGEVEDKE